MPRRVYVTELAAALNKKNFKELLNIPVIGTEISHTAEQFPDTIQWDFHNIKEEWINNTSFFHI